MRKAAPPSNALKCRIVQQQLVCADGDMMPRIGRYFQLWRMELGVRVWGLGVRVWGLGVRIGAVSGWGMGLGLREETG